MKTTYSLAVLLLLSTWTGIARAQDSQPSGAVPECAVLGGTCMEGCEAGLSDIGAHGCFDATCCRPSNVDQSNPISVVAALFTAAQSGDFTNLGALCDPTGEGDGDTEGICRLAADVTDSAEFVEYFRAGAVAGEAVIEGDTASVPITFGPDGSASETVQLVKRGDRWYLHGF